MNFWSWVSFHQLPNNCLQQINLTWAAIQPKTSTSSVVDFKKHVTPMNSKLEPAIWSHDFGQRIPCFDRCQLTIKWTSNIKELHYKPRLHVSVNLIVGARAILQDSAIIVIVIIVMCTRPWAIPLAMITTRKSMHEFPLLSYMGMVLHLVALPATRAPL